MQCFDKPTPPTPGRSRTGWLILPLAIQAIVGCGPRTTRFFITDHTDAGPAERYYEEFDECYFALDADGQADIVARRCTPGGQAGDDPVIQILHIRQVWAAVPGRTFAEKSMINATVSYVVAGPTGGISFEGGGFVTFTRNRRGSEIRGKLESSALAPRRRLAEGGQLFSRASVVGTFRAQRDKRAVIRILHEVQRLFGPMPPYEPPPVSPDLR